MTTKLPSLMAHTAWADQRTLAMLRALPSPPPQALTWFAHILGAQHIWLNRIGNTPPSVAVWPTLSLDECEQLATENHAALIAIAAVSDNEPDRVLQYRNTAGVARETPVQDILLHVTHHGMYHRGQITMLVREAGGTPLATDYIAFLWA